MTGRPEVRIDVFSIFPTMLTDFFGQSLLGKAQERKLVDINVWDLRAAADDPHRSVDDAPFGGGAGMVLMAPPVFEMVERAGAQRPLFLLGPGGRRLDQALAAELAAGPGFSLVCGRYEGVDDRVRTHLCDGEISIGDVVLNGGEVAAMAVVEAAVRLVPGVMGNAASAGDESFSSGLLEYPQYTRPADYRGWVVPEVLRSGDHGRVERWRRAQALARTLLERPDLVEARGGLSTDDRRLLVDHDLLVGPVAERATTLSDSRPAGAIDLPASQEHHAP